jgi:hypothetical protein
MPECSKHSDSQVSEAFFAEGCFGHLNFGHSYLPFDFAQGGELVEPFRISCFEFRISPEAA